MLAVVLACRRQSGTSLLC